MTPRAALPLLGLLSLFVVTPISSVCAQSVTIRVHTPSGRGVDTMVYQRVGSRELPPVQTGEDGELVLSPMSCAPNIYFRLNAISGYVAIDESTWRPCGDIDETGRVRITGSGMASILASNREFAKPAALGATAQSSRLTFEFARLEQATEYIDFALAANELAALYRQAGEPRVASLYSAAAIEAAATFLASTKGIEDTPHFVVEQPNGRLAESDAAHDLLLEFQRNEDLGSRTWDFSTFVALDRVENASLANSQSDFVSANEP